MRLPESKNFRDHPFYGLRLKEMCDLVDACELACQSFQLSGDHVHVYCRHRSDEVCARKWLKPDFHGRMPTRHPVEFARYTFSSLANQAWDSPSASGFRAFAGEILRTLPARHNITELVLDLSDHRHADLLSLDSLVKVSPQALVHYLEAYDRTVAAALTPHIWYGVEKRSSAWRPAQVLKTCPASLVDEVGRVSELLWDSSSRVFKAADVAGLVLGYSPLHLDHEVAALAILGLFRSSLFSNLGRLCFKRAFRML